jgi:peptidoglycan/xylan/chitin deacetylase (PgdA/CDA1 family)
LCYHRVIAEAEPGLFPEVVSASPEMFDQHLELIGEHHTVVSLDDAVAWLSRGASLPPRAALLTFDDGYRDNYELAFPILRRRGLPATFFLATGHMDTGELLWWDLASALITGGDGTEVDLPLIGPVTLPEPGERVPLVLRWVSAAKALPHAARMEALEALAGSVSATPVGGPRVAMSWDEAREMADAGMDFGGHTRSHPILSRLSPDDARREIVDGVDRIREELGSEVLAFAYPNGGRADFGPVDKRVLAELGVALAFSLITGPTTLSEIGADPFEVRRIYVGREDDPERLRLKLLGWSRLSERARRLRQGPAD